MLDPVASAPRQGRSRGVWMKPFRLLLGFLTGAAIVTYPVALILLYGITGKLLVAVKGQEKLMDPDQAIAEFRALAIRAKEQFHG